ncbi:hypothetical protein SADUNF_Sadunf04G0026100 [Salix dunnii]|uniref:Uncharacterized protein n=1 Tax=Salix dunnii TaxID=1413687 RepID=A0A835MYI2_9ROSI|nr:hypothetical protein SADUNF_Sadunf04G0026100 [Salix dunnii]
MVNCPRGTLSDNVIKPGQVVHLMRQNRQWAIFKTSAIKGEGLFGLLQHLEPGIHFTKRNRCNINNKLLTCKRQATVKKLQPTLNVEKPSEGKFRQGKTSFGLPKDHGDQAS